MLHIVFVEGSATFSADYQHSVQIYLDKPAENHQLLLIAKVNVNTGHKDPFLDDERLELKAQYPEQYEEAIAEAKAFLDLHPAQWKQRAKDKGYVIR